MAYSFVDSAKQMSSIYSRKLCALQKSSIDKWQLDFGCNPVEKNLKVIMHYDCKTNTNH